MTRRAKILVLLLVDSMIILTANLFSYIYMLPYVKVTATFFVAALSLQLGLYIILGFVLKVFTRINRFTNIKEIGAVFAATSFSSGIEFLILFLTSESYSRRYVVLTYLLSVFFIILSRIVWRIIVESLNKTKTVNPNPNTKKTLIIGAGEAGRILLNSLNSSTTNSDIQVVGLIDDSPDKFHTYLGGVKVLGSTNQIPKLVKKFGIEMLTIAIPSLSPEDLQRILTIVTPLDLPINSMPALEEVASGNITISRLREIDVVNLLGRDEVKLDMMQIKGQLANKTVLVTGAGGSIGSEVCRQIMNFGPKKIVLLGHGENSIYMIEKELKSNVGKVEIVPVIADIQDRKRIFEVMKEHSPNIVYHAAAHKHVPLMEANPSEALKNNVFGTKNVAEAAKTWNVESFVMISTDKAVNPPNVMGATKRIAEMIVTGLNETGKTKFCAVRFGNVLGSRGSVIPVFKEQINKGGPITVTDFRMTRYFMTIPEASRLVIQAGSLAAGGEIFILDMGEPVKIVDLAKNMIKLSGYKQDQIEIVETGIRPGEKLYEELLVNKEKNSKQVFDKIFIGNIKGFCLSEVLEFVSTLPSEDEQMAKELIRFANESSK